jgi:triphosphatase
MRAPEEFELKFQVPPASVKLVNRLPALRRSNVVPRRMFEVSVYYDTETHKLQRHGMMLRVRRSGETRKQTIKATRPGRLARTEWEAQIDSDTPDFRLAKGTALEQLMGQKLKRRLKPLFETSVRRTVYPFASSECCIELAVDRGMIASGNDAVTLSEVELELKNGEEAALFALARDLIKAVPAQLVLRSKAEQGYRLIEQKVDGPAKAGPIMLVPGMGARDAFRAIGFGCLKQVVDNEPALSRGDPEGVHQMRIGLRRLRAAISLFDQLLQDQPTEAIKAELKWLTRELASARELEVLIGGVVVPARKRSVPKQGLVGLSRELEDKRKAALGRARTAVNSGRFRRLMLEIAAWLEIGDWNEPRDALIKKRGDVVIEEFAAAEMERRWQKIRKSRRKLDELDARRRHKFRIQGKKMRYAAEFFAEVFPRRREKKRRKAFDAAMKRLQDCLGDLNDIAVHEKIISARPGADSLGGPRRSFAAGLLAGSEGARIDPVMAHAIDAYEELANVKAFWR